jgi:Fe-Mn family superoxide dismutase
MNKRDFLKTGFVGALGLISIPSLAKGRNLLFSKQKEFILPELPYAYDALEPYIDSETMMVHHDKHHAGYTAKLNAALKNYTGPPPANVKEILTNASQYNDAIVNNGGGFLNHKLYWKFMSPEGGGTPNGPVAKAIQRNFGSFDNFREEFNTAAVKLFGSGWAWLIIQDGKLKITTTANQDNPFMDTLPEDQRGFPLLNIDVWEHAYYLKYQNRRAEYVNAFWNVVNWEFVNKRYDKVTRS